ncbi:Ig-like domain-containing protein [Candidatus Curtissbacteria bacterium]|nr:Ig-like domain-containing protein [Candidatus Curtissbacteria bacterium]
MKVSISHPDDHARVDSTFETEANVSTGKKITKVEFYVDGNIHDTKTDANGPYKFNYSTGNGKHTIKVKAYNDAGKDAEKEIKVSVGEDWHDN